MLLPTSNVSGSICADLMAVYEVYRGIEAICWTERRPFFHSSLPSVRGGLAPRAQPSVSTIIISLARRNNRQYIPEAKLTAFCGRGHVPGLVKSVVWKRQKRGSRERERERERVCVKATGSIAEKKCPAFSSDFPLWVCQQRICPLHWGAHSMFESWKIIEQEARMQKYVWLRLLGTSWIQFAFCKGKNKHSVSRR